MSQISVVSDIVELPAGAYKLIVQTTGDNMPSAIFAIECLPKSADPKNVNYRFSHVCSLAELVEFPDEETPEMCYFRTNDIEMVFDTSVIASQVLDNLIKDINKLVTLYNQMNTVEASGSTITIGGATV